MARCAFCGGDGIPDTYRPIGGLYRGKTHRVNYDSVHQVAICIYCTRAALRCFGEVPDVEPNVLDFTAAREARRPDRE
jgi:hypothetical protein